MTDKKLLLDIGAQGLDNVKCFDVVNIVDQWELLFKRVKYNENLSN